MLHTNRARQDLSDGVRNRTGSSYRQNLYAVKPVVLYFITESDKHVLNTGKDGAEMTSIGKQCHKRGVATLNTP